MRRQWFRQRIRSFTVIGSKHEGCQNLERGNPGDRRRRYRASTEVGETGTPEYPASAPR